MLLLFVLACKSSAPCEPWQVLREAGELANPPVSATQPAGSHQQIPISFKEYSVIKEYWALWVGDP